MKNRPFFQIKLANNRGVNGYLMLIRPINLIVAIRIKPGACPSKNGKGVLQRRNRAAESS
jgi:hypothetical protein